MASNVCRSQSDDGEELYLPNQHGQKGTRIMQPRHLPRHRAIRRIKSIRVIALEIRIIDILHRPPQEQNSHGPVQPAADEVHANVDTRVMRISGKEDDEDDTAVEDGPAIAGKGKADEGAAVAVGPVVGVVGGGGEHGGEHYEGGDGEEDGGEAEVEPGGEAGEQG